MENFLLLIALLMVLMLYLVPSVIAFRRQHPKRWLLLLANVFTGFTVLGWILCFVWAFSALQKLRPSVDGCFIESRGASCGDRPQPKA